MSNTIKDTLVELLRDAKAELKLVERERDKARNAMAQAQGELDLKTLDFERMREQRDQLKRELAAERALADRLAEGLRKMVLYSEALILRIQDRSDINFKTLNECIDLFNEWKEARSE